MPTLSSRILQFAILMAFTGLNFCIGVLRQSALGGDTINTNFNKDSCKDIARNTVRNSLVNLMLVSKHVASNYSQVA